MLTAGLVSAHLGSGYGVAVLAVTLTAGAILLPPKNPAPLAALAFVALLAAHRLFAHQGLNDIRNFGLSEQYALLGIVVGAALPALCARLAARYARNVFGPVVAATPLLFAPVAISALYGPRAALAVFLGLIVAAVPGLSGATNKRLAPAGLFALAARACADTDFPALRRNRRSDTRRSTQTGGCFFSQSRRRSSPSPKRSRLSRANPTFPRKAKANPMRPIFSTIAPALIALPRHRRGPRLSLPASTRNRPGRWRRRLEKTGAPLADSTVYLMPTFEYESAKKRARPDVCGRAPTKPATFPCAASPSAHTKSTRRRKTTVWKIERRR